MRDWGFVRSRKSKLQRSTVESKSHAILSSNDRKTRVTSLIWQSEDSFKHETGISSASANSDLTIWTLADGDPCFERFLNCLYFERGHPSQVYRPGVVFAVLRRARASDRRHGICKASSICSSIALGQDQRKPYSICLFVVAKDGPACSVCIQICTYGGAGLKKPGLSKDEVEAHAVISIRGAECEYLPNEPRSPKRNLSIESESEIGRLSQASRADFAHPIGVSHNEKVMVVGKLDEISREWFLQYYRAHANQRRVGGASNNLDASLHHGLIEDCNRYKPAQCLRTNAGIETLSNSYC